MESRADAVVLFGATGDLVRKKLMPALYQMAKVGRLGVPVIGVARSVQVHDDAAVQQREQSQSGRCRRLAAWSRRARPRSTIGASSAGPDDVGVPTTKSAQRRHRQATPAGV